jgi:hypothetical protein
MVLSRPSPIAMVSGEVAPLADIEVTTISRLRATKPDINGSAYSITLSARDQRRDSEAERPRGLEVDDEFECGRLLDRDQEAELPSGCGRYSFRCGEGRRRCWRHRRRGGATANSRPPLIAGTLATAMSAAFDARNGSLSTMSVSALACVIAAIYYSSLMPCTYLCARLLETLN